MATAIEFKDIGKAYGDRVVLDHPAIDFARRLVARERRRCYLPDDPLESASTAGRPAHDRRHDRQHIA